LSDNGEIILKSSWLDKDQLVGLSAVIAACLTSGFSGVYFEKILKGSKTSLWIRNIQLGMLIFVEYSIQLCFTGLFSMLFGGIGVMVHDWSAIKNNGFFQGYTYIVGVVILLQVS